MISAEQPPNSSIAATIFNKFDRATSKVVTSKIIRHPKTAIARTDRMAVTVTIRFIARPLLTSRYQSNAGAAVMLRAIDQLAHFDLT